MRLDYRLGFIAAIGLLLVGIAYVVAVAFGVAQVGLSDPIVDPALAVMEIITLLAAPLVVILMAAVYGYAGPDRKPLALIALCFGVLMAGLTSSVHFVALSAGRQTGFSTLAWPSTLYAAELLAWDVFLGLSLLFAAPVFAGAGRPATARRLATVTGALCLAGAIGPIVGDMALQRIGILGYGILLPITCLAMARVFRHGCQGDQSQVRTGSTTPPGARP